VPTIDFHLLVKHEGRLYVANPVNYYPDPTDPKRTPTTRPASLRDMSAVLSEANTQVLDLLAAENWMPHELQAVAQTFGYTEQEVMRYQGLEDAGKVDPFESYFRVSLIAAVTHEIIVHKATVDNLAVLQATDEQLPEWEAHYIAEARDYFDQMRAVEETVITGNFADSAKWCILRSRFFRQAELLGQVQMRLGRFKVDAEVPA